MRRTPFKGVSSSGSNRAVDTPRGVDKSGSRTSLGSEEATVLRATSATHRLFSGHNRRGVEGNASAQSSTCSQKDAIPGQTVNKPASPTIVAASTPRPLSQSNVAAPSRLVASRSPGEVNESFSSNDSGKAGNRVEVRGIEISYSSTLLFMWAVILAYMSYASGSPLQAATIIVLSAVAVTSDHGESRLLWPLVFLSERCLGHVQNLQHSPIEFYSSTVLSYLTLVACKAERRGKSARDKNVVLESITYAAAGLFVVFFTFKEKIVCFAAVAFVGSGYVFFLKLLPHLGDNEAVLVSTAVGFYIGDLCVNNNLSIDGGRETVLQFSAPGYATSYTHIASRGMMLGAIYVASILSVLAPRCRVPVNRNSKSSESRVSRRRITIAFFSSFALVATVLTLVVSYQFRENVLLWLYAYIVSSKFRLWTLIAWTIGIPLAVVLVDLFTRSLRQTVRRKLFHFIAVVAFTPAIMVDPAFFAFAISTATGLCATVEVARHYGVYGTAPISRFISRHIDHRDSIKGAVRTHIYLIYGFGVSLILQYRYHPQQLETPVPAIMELSTNLIPGIISLGIVDASAAIIGSSFLYSYRRALGRYLKNNLFTERANVSITHKTTTGTIGGLISGIIFWCVILVIAEVPFVGPTLYSFLMIVVCSLTECFMDGIDNLQMPLVVLGAINSIFVLLLPAPELWVNENIRRPNPTTASSLASALTSPWKNWPPVPEKVKSLMSP